MKPFSRTWRRMFSLFLVAVFLIVAPAAAFYASGYRLNGFSLVETGGLYIAVPVSGAILSINGKEEQVTSFLSRTVFIPNLPAGNYVVDVTAEGFYPWHKKLVVEPKLVTDANAFLVSKEIIVTEIQVETPRSVATSTLRFVTKAGYADILKAFTSTTTPTASRGVSTSTPEDTRNGESIFIEEGSVVVRWMRNASSTPNSFCVRPSSCVTEILIKKGGDDPAASAQFFRGGVVYSAKRSGIFIADADVRSPQIVVPLYQKRGADFRIVNGAIIVKDGDTLYEIEGF